MKYQFIEYAKCSTCVKARKYLLENNVDIKIRDIINDNPNKEELTKWINLSGLPIKSFFNTSGVVYKELKLKDKLLTMSQDEQIKLLASNGKLIKRPLLISDNLVVVGFKIDEYEKII